MTAIVIPSRYPSSRFPGKPLVEINGFSLLYRVWTIANAVQGVSDVLVATDDQRIFDHVSDFGGQAVMTDPECKNGSERVLDAVKKANLKVDSVINLQGDAPLTPPWVLEAIVEALQSNNSIEIVTPAVQLSREAYNRVLDHRAKGSTSGTLVTFRKDMQALYFSRYPIPFLRTDDAATDPCVHKHLGIYGYSLSALQKYVSLEPTQYEIAEGLEQLRALENGMAIKIVVVDLKGRSQWSLDAPEDAKVIADILTNEGELVAPKPL